jgi:hypothetical protein
LPVPPLTATVTDRACAVVMLVDDGVTVTMGVDLMVPPVLVPLSEIVWVAFVPFKLLFVSTSDPVMLPEDVGAKLIDSVQDAPAAKVPADPAVLPINGQADPPELFKVKFVEMLGLFPLDGIENVSAALPLFARVTVCGLSLLVEPTAVVAKLKLLMPAATLRTTL